MALAVFASLLLSAAPARAQVASLGKGWLLDVAGSITSAPDEVISGRNSIKGAYSGTNINNAVLFTDPGFIQLAPNQTYTVTISYRILATASRGFEFGFYTASNPKAGNSRTFNGPPGVSGIDSLRFTLGNFPNYVVGVKIPNTGTFVVDDIRVTDAGGQLVASENAEGPTLAPGGLNVQISDSATLVPEAGGVASSVAVRDLDGDGYPEVILGLTNVTGSPNTPSRKVLVIEASGRMRLAAGDFLPQGVPTLKVPTTTLFADLNGDGLQDMLFSDAGTDPSPGAGLTDLPGSGIGVALNLGGGKYRNVSALVPADLQATRSSALAAGDLDGDGRVEILLPDEPTSKNDGSNTALLRWNGSGFDAQKNWIAASLWKNNLNVHTWLTVVDLDKDGKQDLLVSGAGWGQTTPSFRVLFGPSTGFTAAGVVQLPEGRWGHATDQTVPVKQGGDVWPVVVADFNNDGLPDIFATEEQILGYKPGVFADTNEPTYDFIRTNGGNVYVDYALQVLLNQGSRKFADVTSASSVQRLGRGNCVNLIPFDINNDGFLDVVGTCQTKLYANVRGVQLTTLFLNDGTGAFQVVDGADSLFGVTAMPNGKRWDLGWFVPTIVTPQRTEGIVIESGAGCGGPGFCQAPRLVLSKIVANGSIGTGPNFIDPATFGVPGFNEFYYLRSYPDAVAAIQAGQFKSGLEHYIAVGAAKGYRTHATNNAIPQGVSVWSNNKAFRVTYQDDGNVVIYDANRKPMWFTNTAGGTGGVFVMQPDGKLMLRDAQNGVKWQSGTTGNPGAYFGVQDDGNLVIYSASGTPIWGAYGH